MIFVELVTSICALLLWPLSWYLLLLNHLREAFCPALLLMPSVNRDQMPLCWPGCHHHTDAAAALLLSSVEEWREMPSSSLPRKRALLPSDFSRSFFDPHTVTSFCVSTGHTEVDGCFIFSNFLFHLSLTSLSCLFPLSATAPSISALAFNTKSCKHLFLRSLVQHICLLVIEVYQRIFYLIKMPK